MIDMKDQMRKIMVLLIGIVLQGCTTGISPIEYGRDECHFCGMSVIESQYGAEVVTDTGKIRKFDAIECMVRYVRGNPNLQFDAIVVNTFDQPGKLLKAESCTYLISSELPSPMGAFLTAFSSKEKAIAMQKERAGRIYSWKDILEDYQF